LLTPLKEEKGTNDEIKAAGGAEYRSRFYYDLPKRRPPKIGGFATHERKGRKNVPEGGKGVG